jgi:hypothetical protein
MSLGEECNPELRLLLRKCLQRVRLSRHLAFHVSQVRGPVLAMFGREKGLGPPTVLLFGESFLNSSFDDPILSLLEVGQDLASIPLLLHQRLV